MNKKPHPVRVSLTASGDPGVEVEMRETLEVTDAAEQKYLLAPGADVLAILPSCRDELGISAFRGRGFPHLAGVRRLTRDRVVLQRNR